MTDKENLEAEILGRIIRKAENNGYKSEIENPVSADQQAKLIIKFDDLYSFLYKYPYTFAKAFWGEELCTKARIRDDLKLKQDVTAAINPQILDYYASTGDFYMWQYHLQLMVLEENPIKYLEKFL